MNGDTGSVGATSESTHTAILYRTWMSHVKRIKIHDKEVNRYLHEQHTRPPRAVYLNTVLVSTVDPRLVKLEFSVWQACTET